MYIYLYAHKIIHKVIRKKKWKNLSSRVFMKLDICITSTLVWSHVKFFFSRPHRFVCRRDQIFEILSPPLDYFLGLLLLMEVLLHMDKKCSSQSKEVFKNFTVTQ